MTHEMTAAEQTAGCIDLARRFSGRFRIVYEEQVALWPPGERVWLARVACHGGHVGVQGGDRLVAFTNRPRLGRQLRALPFVIGAQGDAEVRIVFPVEFVELVLTLLRPRRRRQVSAAQRERLATMGAAHRFRRNDGVQGAFRGPESTRGGSGEARGDG